MKFPFEVCDIKGLGSVRPCGSNCGGPFLSEAGLDEEERGASVTLYSWLGEGKVLRTMLSVCFCTWRLCTIPRLLSAFFAMLDFMAEVWGWREWGLLQCGQCSRWPPEQPGFPRLLLPADPWVCHILSLVFSFVLHPSLWVRRSHLL